MKQRRNYMCTINFNQELIDPCEALPDFTTYKGIKGATFQLERGGKKGRLHWQVFLEFEYPVTVKSIIKDTAEQNCQMHVSEDNGHKHPKAGRNYVTKGECIDGHRYAWFKSIGWENNRKPNIKLRPFKEVALSVKYDKIEDRYKSPTKENAMEWLKWGIKESQNYIKTKII